MASLSDTIRVFLDFSSNASGVLDSVTSKVDSLGGRISKVGQSFAPFSLAAAAALGAGVKLAVDFDKALQGAARGLDLNETEVQAFGKSMEKLQAELKYQFASTELANIATEAGKLGVAKEDLNKFTTVVTKLSVAVDKTDKIEELSTNVAKIQTIFKLTVPELENFGAAMNKLDDASSATADQILTFTQMAGKVGAAFKVNQNILASYGTTLISSGAKAGEAATFMNKFLTVLAAPTASSLPAQEAIAKLGYNVSDLGKRFSKDTEGTMMDFIKRLNKIDEVSRREIMARIFGLEHIDNASLLVAQTDNLQKYLKMAGDSTGNIAKLNREFDKLAENSFEGQYKTFVNMTGELGKQLGMIILPGLNNILKAMQPTLQSMVEFAQLHPEISKYAATGLLIVAAFAPLAMTIGGAVSAITGLVGATGTAISFIKATASLAMWAFPAMTASILPVAGALWAAIAPFTPFIAGGAAIGALAYVIINNWKPISGFFSGLFHSAVSSLYYFYNGYKQVFGALGGYIGAVFTNLRSSIQYHISGYSVVFSTLSDYIGSVFTNLIANAKYYGQMLIYGFIQGVQSYAQSLMNTVGGLMQNVRNFLPSSPAKSGALSDLDRTGYAFTDTFLRGIENSGLNSYLNNAFTNPNTNAGAGLSIPGATGAGGGSSVTIQLNYTPNITGSRLDANAILEVLRNDQRNLQKLLQDAVSKLDRRYY